MSEFGPERVCFATQEEVHDKEYEGGLSDGR